MKLKNSFEKKCLKVHCDMNLIEICKHPQIVWILIYTVMACNLLLGPGKEFKVQHRNKEVKCLKVVSWRTI